MNNGFATLRGREAEDGETEAAGFEGRNVKDAAGRADSGLDR